MDTTAVSTAPGQPAAAKPDVPPTPPGSIVQPAWYRALHVIASLASPSSCSCCRSC